MSTLSALTCQHSQLTYHGHGYLAHPSDIKKKYACLYHSYFVLSVKFGLDLYLIDLSYEIKVK